MFTTITSVPVLNAVTIFTKVTSVFVPDIVTILTKVATVPTLNVVVIFTKVTGVLVPDMVTMFTPVASVPLLNMVAMFTMVTNVLWLAVVRQTCQKCFALQTFPFLFCKKLQSLATVSTTVSIPDGVHLISFRHHVWASKEFLIQWVLVALYPGIRWLEREVYRCLLSVADVKECMDLVLRLSSLCGTSSAMPTVLVVSHVLVFIWFFVNTAVGKYLRVKGMN